MHLVDKHKFPKDYDFNVVNDGIDRRSSMLTFGRHRRRSSASQHKADIEDRARRRTSILGKIAGEDGEEEPITSIDENARSQVTAPAAGALVSSNGPELDENMDGLVAGMSVLKFVPTSVRFGRGRGSGRGGFSKS